MPYSICRALTLALVTATCQVTAGTTAAQVAPLSAQNSDPGVMGWMQKLGQGREVSAGM